MSNPMTAAEALDAVECAAETVVRLKGAGINPRLAHVTRDALKQARTTFAALIAERDAPRDARKVDHYVIRANGEWGSFYVREGVDGQGHHWCELTCNTAFGCVGHHWGSMGRPAREFLAGVDKGYLLGKLWGQDRTVFDAREAIADAKRALFESRQCGGVSKGTAREVYDELIRGADNEFHWHIIVDRCDWLYMRMIDGARFGNVPNPQAEGFWRDLWPAFIAELTRETPE